MSFILFSREWFDARQRRPSRLRSLSALLTDSPSGVLRLRAGWRSSRWTPLLRRFAQDDRFVFMVGFGSRGRLCSPGLKALFLLGCDAGLKPRSSTVVLLRRTG